MTKKECPISVISAENDSLRGEILTFTRTNIISVEFFLQKSNEQIFVGSRVIETRTMNIDNVFFWIEITLIILKIELHSWNALNFFIVLHPLSSKPQILINVPSFISYFVSLPTLSHLWSTDKTFSFFPDHHTLCHRNYVFMLMRVSTFAVVSSYRWNEFLLVCCLPFFQKFPEL